MRRPLTFSAICLSIVCLSTVARAGGGPMNVLVLYNADDASAVAVADYYGAARSLPSGHLCGITGLDPSTRSIDFVEYWDTVHSALVACLQALPNPDEIDYLVVIRGLPYRINLPNGEFYTSLSAMLQIHETARSSDGSPLAGEPQEYTSYYQASITNPEWLGGFCSAGELQVTNPYSSWYATACSIVREADHPPSFRRTMAGQASGYDFGENLFIVTRLDGFDYQDALDLVDRAVLGDSSFPTAELLCMEGSDAPRAARDPECEFTARHLSMAGFTGTWLSPFDSALSGHEVAAYFTGTAGLRDAIAGNTYVPGAIACNLTSTGAAPTNFFCNGDGSVCPASESQTSIARFVRAGATGAHGTVAEPLNNTFPSAGTLLLYTFGYNLGESYFFNQQFLYWQNLYLGDPLTTPYADRPEVTFSASGVVPRLSTLTVQATHVDGVASVRLYLEGVLVADATGGQLDWVVEHDLGAELDLLAVAVADNGVVDRSGWPVETHAPRPDVQGWQATVLTVVEELPIKDAGVASDADVAADSGSSGDASPGGPEPKEGCGCLVGEGPGLPPAAILFSLLIAWVWRRRRRRRR
ncbi:MAG: TIGR03790 family protein [bacterium]